MPMQPYAPRQSKFNLFRPLAPAGDFCPAD
jgi:hypothetical protein